MHEQAHPHLQPRASVPPAPETAPQLQEQHAGVPLDPRYMVMASRIAAYYQQRCQAVANYQQQRCQAWANVQRQKCQEMMQAAMLVVAWYIRDRIKRRRRRQKRQFRRGLEAKCSRPRALKGESVRRWVMGIPEDVQSAGNPAQHKFPDPEETDFSMDKEPVPDSDTKLFNVADNMIKSQLSNVEVPLLGVLSFDDSDNSETEDDDATQYYDDGDEDAVEEYEEDGEDDEADLYEDYDDDDMEEPEENMGSEEVHVGTGTTSRKRKRSSSVS